MTENTVIENTEVQKQMLIQFNMNHNNNKFYYAELNGEQILVRYGRVGNKGVEHKYTGGLKKFESLLKAKRSKGYKDAMIEETVEGSSVKLQKNVIETALNEINYKDDLSKELVKTISLKNVHKITDSTSITFDSNDGLFKTPLGVIQRTGVEQAIKLLSEIEKDLPQFLDLWSKEPTVKFDLQVKGKKRTSDGIIVNHNIQPSASLKLLADKLFGLNEQYFVIIPNKIKSAREMENLLFSTKAVNEQKSTCDALLETLNLIDDLKNKNVDKIEDTASPTFRVEIEHVNDETVFALVNNLFETSKNSAHGYKCKKSRLIKLYRIKLESQQDAFEKCKNSISTHFNLLWHGTKTQNLLSIMSKGLLLPKLSPGEKAGAMFGDGLYFANQSTKSLNYCDGGLWNQNSNENNSVYMFLASVITGNHFVPMGPVSSPPPEGYHSYWAKAGKSQVMNDEIIVFSADQIRLDYILEIEYN
ncbi:Poly [ADP-ribose] polymerase 2 [Smittium culicis]|uniref:Poly [ADP-ribose] polymerase n=1 Tax=Smittium culicis TaxID=133412 RepID=A0A1R1YGQ2_9FUNG|nr:Poly [ADP-ribose] polymerase 2 [Smittium culicis]